MFTGPLVLWLAHLSQRLISELIVYPWSSLHRCPSVRHPSTFRLSFTMLKHLLRNHLADQSQILCEASLGRGSEILFAACGSRDQDGRHTHTVSHYSYAPLFQGLHFLTKMLESNIFLKNLHIDNFFCLMTSKKIRNHSCESFCFVKSTF